MSVLERLSFFFLAAFSAWSAASALRSGVVRAPFGTAIAERANDPVMFWIYVAGMIAVAGLFVTCGVGLVR